MPLGALVGLLGTALSLALLSVRELG